MAEYAGKTVIFRAEEYMNAAIQQYEEETVTHFVVAGQTAAFSTDVLHVNTIRWQLIGNGEGVDIPFDGVPFCWAGKKYMVCHFGKCKTYTKAKEGKDNASGETTSRSNPSSKKKNCPAKVTIKKIVKFPEYKYDGNGCLQLAKPKIKHRLLAALKENSQGVVKDVQFYVKFSAIEDHKDHVMGEAAARKEPVDQRVFAKLEELAGTGITSCQVLQTLVYKYVETELFKDQPTPQRSRRRYFPNYKDVHNFMTRRKKKAENMRSQENLPLQSLWTDIDFDVSGENDQDDERNEDVNGKEGESGFTEKEKNENREERDHGNGDVEEHEQVCVQQPQDENALLTLMKTVLLSSVQEHESTAAVSKTTVSESPPRAKKKLNRIGLVQQMKSVMHEILDYSLLVKDLDVLKQFLSDLQRMSSEASQNASLNPAAVQMKLIKNRQKRSADPCNLALPAKVAHLSDVVQQAHG